MKKNLRTLSNEELNKELSKLNKLFFNTKSYIAHVCIVIITIVLALYAMKDNFSFIILLLFVFLPIYFFAKNLIARKKIINESKSRNIN